MTNFLKFLSKRLVKVKEEIDDDTQLIINKIKELVEKYESKKVPEHLKKKKWGRLSVPIFNENFIVLEFFKKYI